MPDISRLVIAARLENVRHAAEAVAEAAQRAGLDERAVYHCQMAVDEALTNIIEHGYRFQEDAHQIEIVCRLEADAFRITITDDSPPFNPLTHDAPDPTQPLDSREPGGWGIYFIRRLMDAVEYRREGEKNVLTLIKKRLPTAAQTTPQVGFPARALDAHSAVVSPRGRLDSRSAPLLEHTLNAQLESGHTWIVVDMHDVDYIASSGLKVLVAAWRRAREQQGDVILCGLQPRIVEIMEMVGFDMLFQLYPDLESALAARPSKP